MSEYTVYFTASTNDVITITAEDWDLENDLLSFYIKKNAIACFNMKNIFGFEENRSEEDEEHKRRDEIARMGVTV